MPRAVSFALRKKWKQKKKSIKRLACVSSQLPFKNKNMAAAPPLTAAAIEEALISRLPASEASVSDESGGCGAAFCVARVVSAAFAGAPPLKRHRLVSVWGRARRPCGWRREFERRLKKFKSFSFLTTHIIRSTPRSKPSSNTSTPCKFASA